jgi:type I restriction enzyme S subunit
MAMNNQPKALSQRLRFPEFLGQPLQKLQLRDVTSESAVRNGDTLPMGSVMGVTKNEGIVPMQERLIASDVSRYKLVRKDWFAYNPMRLNIGSVARWKGDRDILVSPDYVVFRCLEGGEPSLDPSYLDHFRHNDAWESFVAEGGDGSVRVRIYYEDIARLQLALPTRNEQRKIAECLTSLDEVIAAERRKFEALRAHKKGLMEQLFPRPGESRPRLRFPKFRDAWSERPLGALSASISSGRDKSRRDCRRVCGTAFR